MLPGMERRIVRWDWDEGRLLRRRKGLLKGDEAVMLERVNVVRMRVWRKGGRRMY